MQDILQCDPKSSFLRHEQEIREAVNGVLESGWYILGQQVEKFERDFSTYIGLSHGVGVGNGTDALLLSLMTSDVGAGDAVITVSHTAVATVSAISQAGAIPVFVDIDPSTYVMDPARLEDTIKYIKRRQPHIKLKAIIPVHLYGQAADMRSIMSIAQANDLVVIEDCAQSHGALIESRKTGSFGHYSAFSFYPTKNLCTFGDGGMLLVDDVEMADKAKALRQYGWEQRFISNVEGMNSRLDEIHAAILNVQLAYLDDDNNKRIAAAKYYSERLADSELVLPQAINGVQHVYHQYVVRTPERDDLSAHLLRSKINTAVHYPKPVHLQKAYQRDCIIGQGGLVNTESICHEILSLPMHPGIDQGQIDIVCQSILDWNSR